MESVRFNPKKHKEHRRKSRPGWQPAASVNNARVVKADSCRECQLRPREVGSRCKKCINEFRKKNGRTDLLT